MFCRILTFVSGLILLIPFFIIFSRIALIDPRTEVVLSSDGAPLQIKVTTISLVQAPGCFWEFSAGRRIGVLGIVVTSALLLLWLCLNFCGFSATALPVENSGLTPGADAAIVQYGDFEGDDQPESNAR